jgi:hypothetical protein
MNGHGALNDEGDGASSLLVLPRHNLYSVVVHCAGRLFLRTGLEGILTGVEGNPSRPPLKNPKSLIPIDTPKP